MKAPIGYIAISEAVDIIGRAMAGASWRPLADTVDAVERANIIWTDPDVDHIITTIAEGCETGHIAVAYRTISGADQLDPAVWQSPSWRNYFDTGTIDLDLPLLDERGRPNYDGRTARCTREIFVRRDSLKQFMASLPALGGRDGMPASRPSRGPKAGISIRVADEMLRDLTAGKITAERLLSEPEKILAERYRASRDTVRKVRRQVLSKPVETPK